MNLQTAPGSPPRRAAGQCGNFGRARQAGITSELAEIIGGAAALE